MSAAVYHTQEERQQLIQRISETEDYHSRLTVHLIEDPGVRELRPRTRGGGFEGVGA